MLFLGKDVPVDKENAVEYIKSATNKGKAEEMCRYTYALFNGIGINVDKKEDAKYYGKTIDK